MPVKNKKRFCRLLAFSPTQHFELLTAASELFTRWKLPLHAERGSDRPMGSWLLLLFAWKAVSGGPERSSPTTASSWFGKSRQRVDSASSAVGATNIYGAPVHCVSNTVLDEVTKGLVAVRERGLNAPCLSGGPRERQREDGHGGTEGLAVMVTNASSPRRR